MWFKVVIRRNGEVASCEHVADASEDGASVFFVDAANKTEAIGLAKKLKNERKRAIVVRLKKAGLCVDCRKPNPRDTQRCKACTKIRSQNTMQRRAGTFIPKTHEELSAVHRLRPRMSAERLLALLEVQRHLDEFGYRGFTAFRRWLAEAIGGEVAEPAEASPTPEPMTGTGS